MKVDIEEKIGIPEKMEVNIEDSKVNIKIDKGSLERRFFYPGIHILKKDNIIILKANNASKNEKKMLNTFRAHIENMIKGLKDGHCYKLKICSSHFPMNVNVEGKNVVIRNFLGEKAPRKAKIIDGVEVEIKGDEIEVKGYDREKVGQTAANIESSTRISKRDRRIFADGIYITDKEK